jgi:DNA modification methylase
MWLHVDYRVVYELKKMCDKYFGNNGYVGEVVYVPGNGAKRTMAITHQTILIYGNKVNVKWNKVTEQYSSDRHFNLIDDKGKYRERIINNKSYKYYHDDGRCLGTVWTDILSMSVNSPSAAENANYPTQKPIKLLKRIIELSTNPGDIVCDPMCGSGTTGVAAVAMGRGYIIGDMGDVAIRTAQTRLSSGNLRISIQNIFKY